VPIPSHLHQESLRMTATEEMLQEFGSMISHKKKMFMSSQLQQNREDPKINTASITQIPPLH